MDKLGTGATVLALVGFFGYIIWDTSSPSQQVKRLLIQRAADKQCRQPYHVATAPDSTQLWAVKENCSSRVVYFSSKGTSTTHDEIHGKTHVEVEDMVPSGQ